MLFKWQHLRVVNRLLLTSWLFLTLVVIGSGAFSPVKAADNSRYFAETGHTVSGKFLDYWNTHGGLAVFGFPITDAQNEVDPETGKTFLTQWFERNRFELHPENAGTKYEVLLGLLGKDLNRDRLTSDPNFKPSQAQSGATFFSETGHNVKGGFLTYWQQNGGLERFGFPISEEHNEVDPETGKTFVMQWFERARFEYHPENQPPYNVLLGLLGKQLKAKPANIKFAYKFAISDGTPEYLTVDSQRNIYVNTSRYAIQKYDSQGRSLQTFVTIKPSDRTGKNIFDAKINGIATDRQGNLYVANGDSLQVEKYDPQGKLVTGWFSQDKQIQAKIPNGVAVDSQGNVYAGFGAYNNLSGLTAFSIQKFDNNGKLLLTYDLSGLSRLDDSDKQVTAPIASMGIDSAGNLYLADGYRVLKFDPTGKFVLRWRAIIERQDPVTGDSSNCGVSALTVDKYDNILGLCGPFGIGYKFTPTGTPLPQWDAQKLGAGPMDNGRQIATDGQGNIYVSSYHDGGKSEIVVFNQN